MKILVNLLIALGILCSSDVISQDSPGAKTPMLYIADFSSFHNDSEYDPTCFNYHEYEELTLQEWGKSFELEDIEQYTLYVVLSHDGTDQLLQVNADQKVVKISPYLIEGKQNIPIQAEEEFSHVLLYSGSSGKALEEEVSPQVNFGDVNSRSSNGKINLAEVILFDKVLTKKEILKVQSQLAIKYGVSLPRDSSYFNTDGVVVYDPEGHLAYNHRVIGIAKDQDLKVSQTTHHQEKFLRIGLGGIAPVSKHNVAALDDNSYLFIGDNNRDLFFVEDELRRKWKVSINHPKFADQLFSLKFPKEGMENFASQYNYFLSVSPNEKYNEDDSQTYLLHEIDDFLVVDNVNLLPGHTNQYLSLSRAPKTEESLNDVSFSVQNLQILGQEVSATLQANGEPLSGVLCLYTVDGYLLDKTRVNDDFNFEKRYQINQPGTYFLSFLSGKDQLTKKIIIQ